MTEPGACDYIHIVGEIAALGEFEQLILLAVLRLGEGAYGATIHQEIEQRTERAISLSAVYTTLDRMEAKGFVGSRLGEPTPQRGGRRKKFYALSAAGSEALSRSYRTFRAMTHGFESQLERG